jgi:hypothetical protein
MSHPAATARLILASILLVMLAMVRVNASESTVYIEINDDIEIEVLHIGDHRDTALIWFACNQGVETAEYATARKLQELGYQTYFPDMLSAHFLSSTASNIAKVPAQEVERVVLEILRSSDARRVYLVGGARAAVPVLKGLAREKIRQASAKLKGALLITPRINAKRPVPGSEPVYIDAVGRSRHPIRVLEGERTPNRWGLPHLKQALARSGSEVSSDLIKGVRGFFYLRGDQQTPAEQEMTSNFHQLIDSNIQIMRKNHD